MPHRYPEVFTLRKTSIYMMAYLVERRGNLPKISVISSTKCPTMSGSGVPHKEEMLNKRDKINDLNGFGG